MIHSIIEHTFHFYFNFKPYCDQNYILYIIQNYITYIYIYIRIFSYYVNKVYYVI